MQTHEMKRLSAANNKPSVKRRQKYYDPITEDEMTYNFNIPTEAEYQNKLIRRENSEDEEVLQYDTMESLPASRLYSRKKRYLKPNVLNKEDIDNSKIISEFNIDSGN